MEELLMTDVNKKFAEARKLCPGMSEEVYALTDYLASVANSTLYPGGVVVTLLGVRDDLEKNRCGFSGVMEFPEYFITHGVQARAQMRYLLQVIDAIAEPDFAEAVRRECKEVFGWNVPKRIVVASKVSEHDYIGAAVDWWAEMIQHPKMDNGEAGLANLMTMFGGSKRQLTEPELQVFRESLAAGITEQMGTVGRCTLDVDYSPDHILGEAGARIGLNRFDFPRKTTMYINESTVTVSIGCGAPEQVIWRAEQP